MPPFHTISKGTNDMCPVYKVEALGESEHYPHKMLLRLHCYAYGIEEIETDLNKARVSFIEPPDVDPNIFNSERIIDIRESSIDVLEVLKNNTLIDSKHYNKIKTDIEEQLKQLKQVTQESSTTDKKTSVRPRFLSEPPKSAVASMPSVTGTVRLWLNNRGPKTNHETKAGANDSKDSKRL